MLPVEYEEVYCSQFSYELALIIYTRYRTVAEEPNEYDVYDYHFNAKLGLGVHKKIGFAVVFHRDARKNFIIPLRLFERYAQAICSKIKSFTEAIRCQQAKDEIVRHLEWDCEVGEPGFEHGRGRISPQSKPIQALPIHFGFGCDCGIIRRQFGELSRHPCIQKDTIRPVAYQKFPQVKGRMAANFEVYCPTYGGYVEDRARMKRGSKVPSSVASSSSNAPVLNVRTTNVPNLQHHPLVKRTLQEVDCDAVDTQVSGMTEASMVAKIAQLLVGAMALLNANINQINLAGLRVVRLPWVIQCPRPPSITGRLPIIRHLSTRPMCSGPVIWARSGTGWVYDGSLLLSRVRFLILLMWMRWHLIFQMTRLVQSL